MLDPARRIRILKKMEKKLIISLYQKDNDLKLSKAIKRVREAKLSLFKGQRKIALDQQNSDDKKPNTNIKQHLNNIKKKIELWKLLSNEDIVKQYNQKNP